MFKKIDVSKGINNLASAQQAEAAKPSENVFILTSRQLQEIVKQATQPLQDKIDILEGRMNAAGEIQDKQDEKINSLLNHDKLPGKIERERVEKIVKYLHARQDHKASFETLKGHLKLNDSQLSQAITALGKLYPGKYRRIKEQSDKRKRWLQEVPKVK